MRKPTAPKTRQGRSVAPSQASGLIARGKPRSRSAAPESALDNRSHRTSWGSAAGDFSACCNVCQRRYPGTCHASESNASLAPDCSNPWVGGRFGGAADEPS
jgi:hypothetical protein